MVTRDGALLSWKWLNICLEVVNEFLVLLCLCAQLLLCLFTVFISIHEFSHFHPQNFLPHPAEGSEQAAAWG